ncbi:MAG TPA: ATP-dependent protease, partial [Aquirhabdus sp.]
LGVVQPIGGINPKIEGFFDACQLQGLNGQQGVILPIQNVQHLMLRQNVIDAVREGRFHLYAVRTVEEALSLLMKRPAGMMNAKGRYEKDTIFGEVMNQLKHWQRLEEGDRTKNDTAKNGKDKKAKVNAKAKTDKVEDTTTDKEKPKPKKKPIVEKSDKSKSEKVKEDKSKRPRKDPEDNNDQESIIEWAGE